MIQAFIHAPRYHVLVEIALVIWILRLLFFTKSYRSERTVLTEKEKEDLIEDWQPEPLAPPLSESDAALLNVNERIVDRHIWEFCSKIGKHVTVNGHECLNLASMNFLAMNEDPLIEEDAVASLRKYGVGSCGPRGFYGTVDVHLFLEEALQKFMGCEEAIIYSYGFSTVASAIPAYSKRGDILYADESVHFAIQKGIQASRSRVRYFKHNDMDDLERLLQEQEREDQRNPKKAKVTRKFILVEGLSMKHGDLCPLPKLVELKNKYRVRVFMDESLSFGTIGKTGKGVTEFYNIDVTEIDLITGSLEYALGSVGGFCVGKSYVVDHQRLSGLGYCFSASNPPMLSQAAITALQILQDKPEKLERLQENSKWMHRQLAQIDGLKVSGEAISPIIYVQLSDATGQTGVDRALLQRIVSECEIQGIALTCPAFLDDEELFVPPPSIRVAVNCDLTKEEIDEAIRIIQNVVRDVLSTRDAFAQ
ncbi:hypothetical protein CAPTEDRAFT_226782 [Capitella teleta]|uniref:Serine palmitoyltransferase 1 n=1 Tax=Capitella teleta TaxID=283909 RepID=N1PB18_CAPTE|nr:hypothetical protein CAPTEDRAFT_226782 [Capitella teleta]|eukprot:ELU18888.1 hypothetical protein CAPTEDRAFT_226782 [Capitella teleta]